MKKINAAKKGLITAIIMIGLSLFSFYILHKPVQNQYQYLIFTTYTLGIIWSVFTFSRTVVAGTKFKEYFAEGFKTFIVVTLLMVIYTIVFYKLNPQLIENEIALNNQLAIKEGNHTPMEIEANAKQMRSIFITMTTAIVTIMYLFLGALISAVTTGVIMQMKKN